MHAGLNAHNARCAATWREAVWSRARARAWASVALRGDGARAPAATEMRYCGVGSSQVANGVGCSHGAADEEEGAGGGSVRRGVGHRRRWEIEVQRQYEEERERVQRGVLLRWRLLLRSRRQDGGRGGQVAAVRCCVGTQLGGKRAWRGPWGGTGHSLHHSCRERGSFKASMEAPASAQSDSTAGRMAAPAAGTPAVGTAAISAQSGELSLRLRTWCAADRGNTRHLLCRLTCA